MSSPSSQLGCQFFWENVLPSFFKCSATIFQKVLSPLSTATGTCDSDTSHFCCCSDTWNQLISHLFNTERSLEMWIYQWSLRKVFWVQDWLFLAVSCSGPSSPSSYYIYGFSLLVFLVVDEIRARGNGEHMGRLVLDFFKTPKQVLYCFLFGDHGVINSDSLWVCWTSLWAKGKCTEV